MRNKVIDGILALPLPLTVSLLYLCQLQQIAPTFSSGGNCCDGCSTASAVGDAAANIFAGNISTRILRRRIPITMEELSQTSRFMWSIWKLKTL